VRVRSGLGQLAAHLVLVAFSAAVLLPLLWVLASSLAGGSGRGEPDLGGYVEILTARPFATWFLNSLAVGLGSTAVALPPAAMLAYAFARLGTGGERLRLAVLAGQALPPIAIFLGARLLDTRAALIVAHVALNLPFLTWMLIASFEGDAKQLEETARVEGASRPRAFLKAALPAAAPDILAAGLLAFVLSWNELLLALVLSGEAAATLPVGLASLEARRGEEVAPLAAALVLASLPAVALLPLLRRHLARGLSLGAVR
jgi:multiple sugar transport system permease protein